MQNSSKVSPLPSAAETEAQELDDIMIQANTGGSRASRTMVILRRIGAGFYERPDIIREVAGKIDLTLRVPPGGENP
jgi:hypothetical protein